MSETDDDQPILSEEEIEALIDHAATAGDGFDDGQFHSHDFGAGEALTLAKWTELDRLLRAHAEAIEMVLAHSFNVDATIESIEPQFFTVKDLLPVMPERLFLVSTEIAPIAGESHLELPGSLLSFLVNQYFGGNAVAVPKLSGKVTSSERHLGERFAKDILRTMVEIWTDRLQITPSDLFIDITPDRLILTPAEIGYVVLSYKVSVEDSFRGEFRLMLPFEGLEVHETLLMPRKRGKRTEAVEPEWESKLQKSVPDITMEVVGVLSDIETNIGDLLAMKVGMVIPLKDLDQIRLIIEGRDIALGRHHAHEGRRVAQITQFERIHHE